MTRDTVVVDTLAAFATRVTDMYIVYPIFANLGKLITLIYISSILFSTLLIDDLSPN